jgi:glycosyltransferase involved in cell wall biosynthesis
VRVLLIPTFVETDRPGLVEASSDSVGFGITSSHALLEGLKVHGCDVTVVRAEGTPSRAEWIPVILASLYRHLIADAWDVIFMFHSFSPFASDVRRMLDDLGRTGPLVVFTHGSHWDPTDTFRTERYPDLRWTDLGNLMAADRVLVPSNSLRDTIVHVLAKACPSAAGELAGRMRVVGLPIDLSRLERARRDRATDHPVVVFNHSMTRAKRPERFIAELPAIFSASNCRVVMTRASQSDERYGPLLTKVSDKFPRRLVLGEHLAVDSYYGVLWEASVQVSTASHEGFGIATLEAMAAETYCCVPRIGGYPELVGVVGDGLYEPGDSLAGKVLAVVGDDRKRSAVAAALAERAREFSGEAVAARVREVFAELTPA